LFNPDNSVNNVYSYEDLLKLFYGRQEYYCFDYPKWCCFIAKKGFKDMVELGNYYGWSCSFLGIQRRKLDDNFTIHAIDLHDKDLREESKKNGYYSSPILRKRQFSIFQKNIKKHNLETNINVIKGCSWEVADNFLDCSLDYVFIDADHQYESVKKDILAWLPKIKPGGIIAGHDYVSDFGVDKAVQEQFGCNFSIWDEGQCKVWYKYV